MSLASLLFSGKGVEEFPDEIPADPPALEDQSAPPRRKTIFARLVIPPGALSASVTINTEGVERDVDGNKAKMRVLVAGDRSYFSVLRVSTAVGEGYEFVCSDGTHIKGHMFLHDQSTVVVVMEDEMVFEAELLEPSEENVTVTLELGNPLKVQTDYVVRGSHPLSKPRATNEYVLL